MIGHYLIQAKDIELAGYHSHSHKLQHCTSERSATRVVLSKDLAVESESAAEVRDYLGLQQLSVRCVDTREGVKTSDHKTIDARLGLTGICVQGGTSWPYQALSGVTYFTSYVLHLVLLPWSINLSGRLLCCNLDSEWQELCKLSMPPRDAGQASDSKQCPYSTLQRIHCTEQSSCLDCVEGCPGERLA